MLHFPSSLQNGGSGGGLPRRSDSLNATQQKPHGSHQIFLTVEQELHDARRVSSHGQEEDLRSALNMVINRVTELSALLSEAYKSQAELELQLNVAKSNLQLVIANNEMLEEALKSGGGGGRDVGWRRASGTANSRSGSGDAERAVSGDGSTTPNPPTPNPNGSPTDGSSRFFKTFFNGRPGTPTTQTHQTHLTSPSLPSLHASHEDELGAALQTARASAEKARQEAEREHQAAEKARAEAARAAQDKAALEAEIEALSQALFEEANRMVASERMRRADAENELAKLKPLTEELKRTKIELREEVREARETREELREAQEEKAALRSALRLIEGENVELRTGSRLSFTQNHSSHSSLSLAGSPERRLTRSRSSSEVGTKSPVRSPSTSPNIPSSSPHIPPPSPHLSAYSTDDDEPLEFAPTGMPPPPLEEDADAGLLGPGLRTPGDGDVPTPRRGALPLDFDPQTSRTSSPALSPPPTALAPAPEDPWAAA